MTQIKRFFIFLCTLPLFDSLLTLWLHWDAAHADPSRMSGGGFLLLFGGFLVIGLIAGMLFGKHAASWPAVLFYGLLSLFVLPETYIQLWSSPNLFWKMFLFCNVQQAAGFALGAGARMLSRRGLLAEPAQKEANPHAK